MTQFVDYVAFSAVSMGASYNSPTMPGRQLLNGSLQLLWTGTPVGNFTIQASNQLSKDANGSDVSAACHKLSAICKVRAHSR